jgi:hypothetical protein
MSSKTRENDVVELDFAEVAFADFKVEVVKNDSVWVLKR